MDVDNKNDSTKLTNIQGNTEPQDCETNNISSIKSLSSNFQDSYEYQQPASTSDERLIISGQETENHKSGQSFPEPNAPTNCNENTTRLDKIKEIILDKNKSKRVANSYKLRKNISMLPQELQIRIYNKFIDLFGNDFCESDPLSETKEYIITHKNILN